MASEFKIWNEACQRWEYICLHDSVDECSGWLRWVEVPLAPDSPGENGDVARDDSWFYVYNVTLAMWGRTAISYSWSNTTTTTTEIPNTTTTTTLI